MISSSSASNSLLLPLSQLSPHCSRLSDSLHNDRVSNKERILCEQTLWNEVKKIRALNDTSIYLYLIGYYHTILFQIAKSRTQNDLFQYHILIRLGDLNRYMEKTDVAEYYYCNARNLFPLFGHAYNQLGLLTKPTNCYKCCYYYARAAKSVEKPLSSIADSNLRIAVSKYNCEILNHLLDGDDSFDPDFKKWRSSDAPTTAFEWFYVIVVAIYADNIQPIARIFLQYLNESFSTQRSTTSQDKVRISRLYCDRSSYILLAGLDIMLDWLKLGSQSRATCSNIGNELRQIKSSLQTIQSSLRNKSQQTSYAQSSFNASSTNTTRNNTSSTSPNLNSTCQDCSSISGEDSNKSSEGYQTKMCALPHDYVLRGFSPLESVHKELKFALNMSVGVNTEDRLAEKTIECQQFIDASQLNQIVSRLILKLNNLSSLFRKQTRNIALESILSNKDRS